jgi:hypothetical protein
LVFALGLFDFFFDFLRGRTFLFRFLLLLFLLLLFLLLLFLLLLYFLGIFFMHFISFEILLFLSKVVIK